MSSDDNQNINLLKQQLAQKDQEMAEMYAMFKDVKVTIENQNAEIEALKKSLHEKEMLIENYKLENQQIKTQFDTIKASIEMKDTQIQTLTATIKMKDDQIRMKDDQINMKEQQMNAYRQSLDSKIKEIDSIRLDPNKVDKKELDLKEQIIKDLQDKNINYEAQIKAMTEEMDLLKSDIENADEEVEQLHKKIEEMGSSSKSAIFITRDEAIKRMKEILGEALHNVNICVPNIEDLVGLDLYDIKPSVQLKISCDIDMSKPKQSELLKEFQAIENVSLRLYDGKDRWTLLKDNEAMFFVVAGKEINKNLSFYTTDPLHIKLFNTLVMESWLRGRKV